MDKSKEDWRQAYLGSTPVTDGKTAEALRRLEAYRRSRFVFIEPSPALKQMRINALLDGKELIVPGPGLREGFYCLRPFVVPFPKLGLAVSLKGIPEYGRVLPHHELRQLEIGIMVAEALAVDGSGVRLGDGSGFFDLACAILSHCDALSEAVRFLAAAVAHRPDCLPVDPWDVRMHGVLSPQGVELFPPCDDKRPAIDWGQLTRQKIKKITPLWQEWKALHPGGGSS